MFQERIKRDYEDRITAMTLYVTLDRSRFGTMRDEMANMFSRGYTDVYPDNISSLVHMARNYSVQGQRIGRMVISNKHRNNKEHKTDYKPQAATENNSSSVAMLTTSTHDKKEAGQDTKDMSKVRCFKCGEKGHVAKSCPKRNDNKARVNIMVESESPAYMMATYTDSSEALQDP